MSEPSEIEQAPAGQPNGRTKYERVTAEQVEARFAAARERRQEKRRQRAEKAGPDRAGRRRQVVVLSALAAACVGVLIYASVAQSSFQDAHQAGEIQIEEMTDQLEALRATITTAEDTDAEAADLTALVERATQKALEVAELQQGYAQLYQARDAAGFVEDAGYSPEMLASIEHRRELAPYWSTESLLFADDEAYRPRTVAPAGMIDPRFAWYVRYDGATISDPASYSWNVESVMPDRTAVDARVVWTCRQADGVVLAWARAAFDDESGTFSSLELTVTDHGKDHQ